MTRQSAPQRPPQPDRPPLVYRPAEAAEILRVPLGTLLAKVQSGAWPSTKLGRHRRLTAEHLAAIVALGERPNRPPTQAPVPKTAPRGVAPVVDITPMRRRA